MRVNQTDITSLLLAYRQSSVLDLKALAPPSLVNQTLRHLLTDSTELQRRLARQWITLIGTALGDNVKLHQSFVIVFVGLRRNVLSSGSFLIALCKQGWIVCNFTGRCRDLIVHQRESRILAVSRFLNRTCF